MIMSELRTLRETAAELFRNNFDTGYFLPVLEQAAFDQSSLRDIRSFLFGSSLILDDSYQVMRGVDALEEFIAFCRRYVTPSLREFLGISGFGNGRHPNMDLHALKGLFAYTYPHNMDQLEELTRGIKQCLKLMAA